MAPSLEVDEDSCLGKAAWRRVNTERQGQRMTRRDSKNGRRTMRHSRLHPASKSGIASLCRRRKGAKCEDPAKEMLQVLGLHVSQIALSDIYEELEGLPTSDHSAEMVLQMVVQPEPEAYEGTLFRSAISYPKPSAKDGTQPVECDLGIQWVAQQAEEDVLLYRSGSVRCPCPKSLSEDARTQLVETKDAETQCTAKDMLEPMARSPPVQKLKLEMMQKAPLQLQEWKERSGKEWKNWSVAYSVKTHFALALSAEELAERAIMLSEDEQRHLAQHFFGKSIAGVAVTAHGKRPLRRVADKHVTTAMLLCQRSEAFRSELLESSTALLLGSQQHFAPLGGRSLLSRADEDKNWERLAHTGLDFACRLMASGALPKVLAAKLIAVISQANATVEATKEFMRIVKSTVIGRSQSSSSESTPWFLRRTRSVPYAPSRTAWEPESCLLWRVMSTPAKIVPTVRNTGTSLNPLQDPHSAVTFFPIAEEIEPEISPTELPSYWRHAAGGELAPEKLEERAREAEKACLSSEPTECLEKSLCVSLNQVPLQ
mmetsp:Transcript_33192/g.60119  ORF Transcript_33192/g.60119 Transcript_33192/m.60119 type:complete len:543 (+) Transcript_33192:50-1678(+)